MFFFLEVVFIWDSSLASRLWIFKWSCFLKLNNIFVYPITIEFFVCSYSKNILNIIVELRLDFFLFFYEALIYRCFQTYNNYTTLSRTPQYPFWAEFFFKLVLWAITHQSGSGPDQLIQIGLNAVAQRQYVLPVLVPGVRAVRKVLRTFHDHVHGTQKRFFFTQDER